jgi:hypothetical protein
MKRKKIIYFGAVLVCIAMITSTSSVFATTEEKSLINDETTIINPIKNPSLGPGDIIFEYDVQTPTGDTGCLGVEFDGTYFWVTGRDAGSGDIHKLHKFDADGNHITTYEQGTTSTWGWRDLAWDGTYLYASDENELAKIDPATGGVVDFLTKPPGFDTVPCRGLAYDPATDNFYTANWASDIVEFDRDGNIVNSYSNELSIYGLAWDNVTDGGPWLWAYSQDEFADDILVMVSQVDPTTGIPTGVQYLGWHDPGAERNLAGGACFIEEWRGDPIFVGLSQSTPDTVFGMDISIPEEPTLEITDISGGFGGKATIKNTGTATATNVAWSITLNGGIVILGKQTSEVIPSLEPDASTTVKTKLLFGFGKPTVQVQVSCDEGATDDLSVQGRLFLFFLLGL